MNYKPAAKYRATIPSSEGSSQLSWTSSASQDLLIGTVCPFGPLWPYPRCLTLLWEAELLMQTVLKYHRTQEASYVRLFPAQCSSEADAPILHPGEVLQSWHLSLTPVHGWGCWNMAPQMPQPWMWLHPTPQLSTLQASELAERGTQCWNCTILYFLHF